ncbi:carboxymuconolactone decarboxylase family protein [Rubinisphaera sp. JC750]|uniref:carboxymuconolactone decarboxylase family protein n=1 Tax=Rubinisphaera sp. JC750 TaxID=2898658 RepID=UPI001F33ADCE|nr:carboxymuconolactone decarboxylase family protein [Rubinisphaera sp. JC750]
MAEFTTYTPDTASDASKPLLEKSQKSFGFVPNLHGVMAESPELLEAYQTVAQLFGRTDLSETERQIIAMTNNRLNGCKYCMAGHTSIMQAAKVPEDVIAALRDGTSIDDPKLEALRVFAEKMNLSRGWPEESDVEAFLAAGYTRKTMLEVVLGTAFKVLSNYTNHIAETPVDDAFAKNAWEPEEETVS